VVDRPIVVVGAHCPGILVRVARVPAPGETVLGWDLHEPEDGGKATNQAIAAARLGASVAFVSVVGDDARGRDAVALLDREGIDTRHLAVRPGATDAGVIVLADDGIPAIVSTAERAAELDDTVIAAASDVIQHASVVVCQLEAPAAAARSSFARARAAGATTILNPAPASALDSALLGLTDVLVPNATEAASLIDGGDDAGPVALAPRLVEELGVETVIVTAGPDGAFTATRAGERRHTPAPTVEAVDTTGAGDAFVGALAVGLRAGEGLTAAVGRAIDVASRSVARPGSIPSYPRADELV
jgi:ribokinase